MRKKVRNQLTTPGLKCHSANHERVPDRPGLKTSELDFIERSTLELETDVPKTGDKLTYIKFLPEAVEPFDCNDSQKHTNHEWKLFLQYNFD